MKIEYENPWFKIVKDGQYHFLKENGSDNGAIILALINGHFVFVKVNRPAHNMEFIETPRGYGNINESSESCAIRELYEETGYLFNKSHLKRIGLVRPNTAILSSAIPVYLIESSNAARTRTPDEEVSKIVYVPAEDIYKEIAAGKITDGLTLSALSLYSARKHEESS